MDGSTAVTDAGALDRVDVFAAFDTAAGSGVDIDPHTVFKALRQQGSVLPVDLHDVLGISPDIAVTTNDGAAFAGAPVFSVVGFEAASVVCGNAGAFSSSVYKPTLAAVIGSTIMDMDDPEHRRYRDLVRAGFTRRAMDAWADTLMAPAAHRLIDRFSAGDSPDLLREMVFTYPVEVIAGILGLPTEDITRFHRLSVAMFHPDMALDATQRLGEWFSSIIDARRASPPSSDIVSLLVHAELDGERLRDSDIVAFLRLLFPAGSETTYRSLGNLLCGLLTTGQMDRLRENRALIPQAVEEGLRWETPVLGIPRLATRTTEVGGVSIPAGSLVHVFLASANRDERRWDEPDRFDITRPFKPHLAFAVGPHTCLGLQLAKIESAVALDAILDRLPGLRLDPAATDVCVRGLGFRSPVALPVVFDRDDEVVA